MLKSVEQAMIDVRLKLEHRRGVFEKVWKLEIGATPTILGDAISSEIRGSVGECIEIVAEWMEHQCVFKQRGQLCPNSPCEAERVAASIRKMKP